MPFACLPWYDLREMQPATDALWQKVAGYLRDAKIPGVPEALNRRVHYEEQWDSRALLLGQACGYDVALAHADRLQVVAAPKFDLDGCHGARYRSFVVVPEKSAAQRIEDLFARRCVINTPTSHSGMNVLRALVAPLSVAGRFFASVHVSGAHEHSLEHLRSGRADVAAIDCITYGLLKKVRPRALRGLRIIHRTESAPSPPFVTSTATSQETISVLRHALAHAMPCPDICLVGTTPATVADYQPIARSARRAQELGYRDALTPGL